jgi:ubiquinone/menaquinone biosynthesis C-methylase UbiE
LPWSDAQFDVVLQSTVFTSILDERMKLAVAREMLRVLSPTGAIIWYDFRYDNPANKNVRGIAAAEIHALFPGCRVDKELTTLAPPIARRLVPHAWLLASALERLRLLNTHYLAVIRR